MLNAYAEAQSTFKFFWRELSWEKMRIVPAVDMALIKLPFTDGERTDGNPEYEHMWIDEVNFDGETVSGVLINSPNWVVSVKEGDSVSIPLSHLEDWMMTSDGKAYGAYTVNVMRAKMNEKERAAHDQAWDLDFGNPNERRINLYDEKKTKDGFFSGLLRNNKEKKLNDNSIHEEHPMCINMLEKIETQLKQDPSVALSVFEQGFTLLHQHALAGDFGVVKLLLKYGANPKAKTEKGHTAADLATSLSWKQISSYVTNI